MQRYRGYALLGAAYLGTFLASLDISIVNMALPTLQSVLRTDIAGLQWVVNAYAIFLSAFMLSAGPWGDLYGHKRAWMSGIVLFTLGSALCAMAATLPLLLVGRAVQGFAGALLIPGAMPILTHAFPDPEKRAHAIGGWSAFSALALVLGPLLGGLLLHHAGWQSIFLINIPLGLVAIGLGCWGIPERKHPDHAALDPVGQLLSVFWLGALAYGLIEAGEYGFGHTRPLVALILALIGLSAFAVVEARVDRPLFPMFLLRNRLLAAANVASFALGFSCYSSLFFFSIFLQDIQGWAPEQTGWRMLPQFVVTGCVSMVFGRLSARISVYRLMAMGYGLAGLSLLAMATFAAHTSYWIVGTLFGALGLGMGLAVPGTGMIVMTRAPSERAGMASAMMNALRQTGMTIGIALLGTVMSSRASQMLAREMSVLGVADATAIARNAVTRHLFPNIALDLSGLYAAAMASGFHAAMLLSGSACIAAAALLLMVKSSATKIFRVRRHPLPKRPA